MHHSIFSSKSCGRKASWMSCFFCLFFLFCNFIQPLLWTHRPLPGHLRDIILSVFIMSFLCLSFQWALPVLCPQGDAWAASLPGSTAFAQCRGAAQLRDPLGFLSILPSCRVCASSLQRTITLTAWIFVLILWVAADQKWELTGRPNTVGFYWDLLRLVV